MIIDNLIGTWILIGSISINSEIELIGGEHDSNEVEKWLGGKSYELINEVEPTEGLILTITSDGRFEEEKTGYPQVSWFDREGVLQSEVTPFQGYLSFHETNIYFTPADLPSWAMPVDRESRIKLRYDDGDTKISDCIERQNDQLIRTVSVVTDELYLDRVIIVYQRVKQ